MIGKVPERGKESSIEWFITEEKLDLQSTVGVELITTTPKIPDPEYSEINSIFLKLVLT